MKRFLTIVLVAAGLSYAGTLGAQTAPPAPKSSKDSTQATKKADVDKSKPAGGSSDIMIDEGGTPKAKPKKRSGAKSAKKPDAARAAEPSPSPEAPAGIAIDEAGTSKPKPKSKANTETITPPNKSDSAIVAPASQVGRPE